MAGLIIWCLVNPVRDLLGEWFNTKSIKYIEGICSEVEDKMFDYKLATIDGYKVMISTLNHDVKVGDYYRIEYGVHTKAVTYVGRKDIVSQFKDKETEEVTSAQEFLNQYENMIAKSLMQLGNPARLQKAIDKAQGNADGANFENVRYEGYGHGGVAFMVDCLTDNRNRTASMVRSTFTKRGGNLGTDGSVSYMFERRGSIVIPSDYDEEEMMMTSLDAGALDFEKVEDEIKEAKKAIELLGGKIEKIEQKLLSWYNRDCLNDFEMVCRDFNPDIILCTHPFAVDMLSKIKKDNKTSLLGRHQYLSQNLILPTLEPRGEILLSCLRFYPGSTLIV